MAAAESCGRQNRNLPQQRKDERKAGMDELAGAGNGTGSGSLCAIPLDGAAQTFAEIDAGLVAETLLCERDVSEGVANIAGARLGMLDGSVVAGEFAQQSDNLIEGDAMAGGEIHDLAADGIGMRGQQVALDGVLNEGEVAALLAVAVNDGHLAGKHAATEDGENAGVLRGGILMRTEDVEVAQADGFKAVDAGEGTHVVLAGELGDGVGRDGIGRHLLVLGQRGRVAIRRRRSRVNDATDSGGASGDEQLQRGIDACDVGAERIGDRTGNRRQSCFMKDDFDAVAGARGEVGIGEVAFEELHRFKAEEIVALAGGKVIDAANGVSTGKKRGGKRASDETGSAGDEIARQRKSPECEDESGRMSWLADLIQDTAAKTKATGRDAEVDA